MSEVLKWEGHDDGYIWAKGRKGRYEISEGFGAQRGMARLNIGGRIAYFAGFESAKDFVADMDR